MKPTDITLVLGGGIDDKGQHNSITLPLSKAPHILVAGMTGGGKSVVIHDIICQMLAHPSRFANLVLIDPKRVEFGMYAGLPNLAWPWVAYDPDDIEQALRWAESEMRMRFHHMERAGVRSFDLMPDPWGRTLVVIDELANLILANKRLEKHIVAIASMGRAAGVHLLLATQRPAADVITGLIRANVPTRIALPVITRTESRIILDVDGAEKLQTPGDMLIRLPGRRDLFATRGRFRSDQEIADCIWGARYGGP